MHNKLAQDFNLFSLLKFTAPTTISLVFMSMYTMVDAVFVSNLVGENALSALNIIYPLPSIVVAVGIMLATGGSAIVAKNMGEGKNREALENFSMLVTVGLSLGILITVLSFVFIDPLIEFLGATPILYRDCYEYLYIYILSIPLAIAQMLFQTFLITAGRPGLALTNTVLGGVSNIIFDYVFMGIMDMGIGGASLGTAIGYFIPAVIGLVFFAFARKGTLYFVKPKMRFKVLLKACGNGSSEMVTNMAVAVTTLMFNFAMLRLLGENGVAAITIVLYAQFLLTSIFMGFSGGIAPVVSFNYGLGNYDQIKKVFKISLSMIAVYSVLMFTLSIVFVDEIIIVFIKPESPVYEITRHGFLLFAISYIFTGFSIFASSWFTAFSDGRRSAEISFLRTFVFLALCLWILPELIGIDGVWLSVPVAELMALIVAGTMIWRNRKIYHYA